MMLFFLACSEPKVIQEAQELRPAITKQHIAFERATPLNRPEQYEDDWSSDIIQALTNTDKVLGISNLIRSPCIQEWDMGISLAESISKGQCLKSVDWLYTIDNQLNSNPLEEVLFKSTMPGPYVESMSSNHTVWHRSNRKGFQQIIDKVAQLPFEVTIKEWDEDTKEISDYTCELIEDESKCTIQNTRSISNNSWLIEHSKYSDSSPVWFINGYLLVGLQSQISLMNVSNLP